VARSVEVAKDFATDASFSCFGVGHDTFVGGDDDATELTGGKDGVGELLEVLGAEIETGGDHTALVDAAVQVNDDLAGAGIVNNGELGDVALRLHKAEELDQDLGDGSKDNLKT
jgi:hypothetical protein